MSKLVITTLAILSSLSSVRLAENEEINDVKSMIPAWKTSDFNYEYSFEKDGTIFNLYSVYNKKNELEGYSVFNNGNISLIYQGSYIPSKSDMACFDLINPSKNTSKSQNTPNVTPLSTSNPSFSSYSYICKPSDLVISEKYSQSYASYLANVPEYYNDAVDNGCAPTVGAMLISFYDRYSTYSSLYNGLLPLNHDENKASVNAFISTMATYMNTTENGTLRSDEKKGIQNYLDKNKCRGYRVEVSYSLSDYINYYSYSNNPIFIPIKDHAILGIGYSSLRKYSSDGTQSIANFMITHYDWRSRPGNYYVPGEELEQFFYIRKH